MNNGILKNQEKNVFPINNSNNLNHKGFRLGDFIDLMIINLKNMILQLFSYNTFFIVGDNTVNTTHSYQNINMTNVTERKNSDTNLFNHTSEGLEVLQDFNVMEIFFSTQIANQSNTPENKYCKIQIIRDNEVLTEETMSSYSQSGNLTLFNMLNYACKKGDLIKFQIYGTQNDVFTRNKFKIKCQKFLRNMYVN